MNRKKLILCLVLVMTLVLPGSVGISAIFGTSSTIIAETTDDTIETPPPEEEPDPPSIKIQEYPATMEVGETFKLSYALRNSDTNKVTWRSNNPDVLSVDSEGRVTAKSPGSATITATAGDVRDNVSINVNKIKAESIKIVSDAFNITNNVTGFKIKVGDTISLRVEVEPEDADVGDIAWEVNDSRLAEIDSEGTLIAKDNGTVIVTASAEDGALTNQMEIQIGSNIPWALIAIASGVALLIIILIILIVRQRIKAKSKSKSPKRKSDDDDDYDDDDDDDDDDDNSSDSENERKMQEAYRRGYEDREKEITKIFNPKDFDFKKNDGKDDGVE